MTGTDKSIDAQDTGGPAVILVNPQMGENIGAAARAMLNCGLQELRLVNPRDGWPSPQAEAMSSGALERMPPVQLFDSTAASIADCHYVYATTARPRDMVKPVFTARSAAADMHKRIQDRQKVAVLFGAERTGLENDDVAQSHAVVTIPLNPGFSSLNLGQGVLLMAYEWYQLQVDTPDRHTPMGGTEPASHDLLQELFERLETELDAHHFFRNEGQRPIMIRNLHTLLTRAEMTAQEVRTFHGIISALIGKKAPLEK
ncbi:MAG: RNA methyltransferase [Rhodospirillales bacterium]|nr:RNA methyltransferase [Rhodospirillales bacterium]